MSYQHYHCCRTCSPNARSAGPRWQTPRHHAAVSKVLCIGTLWNVRRDSGKSKSIYCCFISACMFIKREPIGQKIMLYQYTKYWKEVGSNGSVWRENCLKWCLPSWPRQTCVRRTSAATVLFFFTNVTVLSRKHHNMSWVHFDFNLKLVYRRSKHQKKLWKSVHLLRRYWAKCDQIQGIF